MDRLDLIPRLQALWQGLRPHQWTKNFFLFAGLLFSRNLFDPVLLGRVMLAFGVFCLLSGAVYLVNDLADLAQDRRHPAKSRRPLASGRLSPAPACLAAGVLAALSLGAALWLGPGFFQVAAGYLLLQAGYQWALRHAVILDVFAIAAGFALRVVAGAVVIAVEASSWLILCTIFLSLFIALGKRRQELAARGGTGPSGRRVLEEYSLDLLDQMISVVAASTVIAYSLYTMSEETFTRFGTRNLVWTVPFVLYGILRYLYLIHRKGVGEEPEAVLLSDRPLLAAGLLWVLAAAFIIYR